MSDLTFTRLREENVARCPYFGHTMTEWSPTDWGCAMAGEAGEACNLIKKLRRGDDVDIADIGRELADTVIYADLLAARLGIDLGEAVRQKWNETSEREGYPGRLAYISPEDARLLALLRLMGAEPCPDCWPVAGAGDCPRCQGRGFIDVETGPDAAQDSRTEG